MRQVYLKTPLHIEGFYLLRYITPYNPRKDSRRFRETCHLHLQDRRINQARNQHETALLAACFTLISCLAYPSLLKTEMKCLHGVVSQTMELYMTTAVGVSNLTWLHIVHVLNLWFVLYLGGLHYPVICCNIVLSVSLLQTAVRLYIAECR
jgi:hypothetical protein